MEIIKKKALRREEMMVDGGITARRDGAGAGVRKICTGILLRSKGARGVYEHVVARDQFGDRRDNISVSHTLSHVTHSITRPTFLSFSHKSPARSRGPK